MSDAQARVASLDPLVHLADGSAGVPSCGAAGLWHAGASNVSEHLEDTTCPECRDLGEERGWERDEERRLAQAGADAAADRYVEDRLIGDGRG